MHVEFCEAKWTHMNMAKPDLLFTPTKLDVNEMRSPVDRNLKEFCGKLTMPSDKAAAADATHASLTTQQHRTNDRSLFGSCPLPTAKDVAATEA